MGWEGEVPDPQARSTFEASMLRWEERDDPAHARMLAWYRELLTLRRQIPPDLASGDLGATSVEIVSADTVLMRRARWR